MMIKNDVFYVGCIHYLRGMVVHEITGVQDVKLNFKKLKG